MCTGQGAQVLSRRARSTRLWKIGTQPTNHHASNIDEARRHAKTVLGCDAKSLILKVAHGGIVQIANIQWLHASSCQVDCIFLVGRTVLKRAIGAVATSNLHEMALIRCPRSNFQTHKRSGLQVPHPILFWLKL